MSGSGASVRPENAVIYSAGNGGQTFCGGFPETAPLQRSNTPSAKGHMNSRPFSCGKRACAICPNSTYVAPRVLHFSASYILRATLAREPIFWGGFSPKAPPASAAYEHVHYIKYMGGSPRTSHAMNFYPYSLEVLQCRPTVCKILCINE